MLPKIKSTVEALAQSKSYYDMGDIELNALLPSILYRAFKGEL